MVHPKAALCRVDVHPQALLRYAFPFEGARRPSGRPGGRRPFASGVPSFCTDGLRCAAPSRLTLSGDIPPMSTSPVSITISQEGHRMNKLAG